MPIYKQFKTPSSKAKKRSLFKYALQKSYFSSVEIKDESYSKRIRCYKPFDEVLEICLNSKSHWPIIYRDMSFLPNNVEQSYWEIAVCTLDHEQDYFIFVDVNEEVMEHIIKKYKLQIL